MSSDSDENSEELNEEIESAELATLQTDAESPDEKTPLGDVLDAFLDGDLDFPEALDALADALAARYDIPLLPEALEEKLLRAVADVVLSLAERLNR